MFSLAQMYLSIASDWSFAIGWTSLVSRVLSVNRLLKIISEQTFENKRSLMW